MGSPWPGRIVSNSPARALSAECPEERFERKGVRRMQPDESVAGIASEEQAPAPVQQGDASGRVPGRRNHLDRPIAQVEHMTVFDGDERRRPTAACLVRERRRHRCAHHVLAHDVDQSSVTRVNSIVQLVSHDCSWSAENACSQRQAVGDKTVQMKRTRIGRPSNVSSP